jgi:hypothetical protein
LSQAQLLIGFTGSSYYLDRVDIYPQIDWPFTCLLIYCIKILKEPACTTRTLHVALRQPPKEASRQMF